MELVWGIVVPSRYFNVDIIAHYDILNREEICFGNYCRRLLQRICVSFDLWMWTTLNVRNSFFHGTVYREAQWPKTDVFLGTVQAVIFCGIRSL